MATSQRARKSKTKDKENSAASLIEALKFISDAQQKTGATHETHCVLANNWAVAFDGILTIGHKIEEEISACPHTETLLTALSKCGEGVSITQLENGKLSIKSGKFKGLVNCDTSGTMPTVSVWPDPVIAPIDDRLKAAFEVAGTFANTVKDTRIFDCSVLVNSGTATGTNGHVLLEYWHGLDLPPNMVVPKLATQAIVKSNKKLSGFGYSGKSATFHFEDGSYIKTQLYVEEWPLMSSMFKEDVNPWPLPEHFFEAIDALLPFTEKESNHVVYFKKGAMQTHLRQEDGSTYEVEGLPEGPIFNASYLKLLQKYIQKVDFSKFDQLPGRKTFFFGENLRGLIAGMKA